MRENVLFKLGWLHQLREILRASCDAQTLQKDALGGDAGKLARGREADGFEIHMGCEVCVAGILEHVDLFVILDGLQRVALRMPVAVVDDQGHTTVTFDPAADSVDHRCKGFADFDHHAILSVLKTMGEGGLRLGCAKAESQGVVVDTDQAFAPCRAFADELADGQGIKEFIGHKERRLFGQSIHRVMPNRAGDQLFLLGA